MFVGGVQTPTATNTQREDILLRVTTLWPSDKIIAGSMVEPEYMCSFTDQMKSAVILLARSKVHLLHHPSPDRAPSLVSIDDGTREYLHNHPIAVHSAGAAA